MSVMTVISIILALGLVIIAIACALPVGMIIQMGVASLVNQQQRCRLVEIVYVLQVLTGMEHSVTAALQIVTNVMDQPVQIALPAQTPRCFSIAPLVLEFLLMDLMAQDAPFIALILVTHWRQRNVRPEMNRRALLHETLMVVLVILAIWIPALGHVRQPHHHAINKHLMVIVSHALLMLLLFRVPASAILNTIWTQALIRASLVLALLVIHVEGVIQQVSA